MPELPEVETVVRGLKKILPGRQILDVRFGKTDFVDDPMGVSARASGKQIQNVRRHGKFLVFELSAAPNAPEDDSAVDLVVHLGMTGNLRVFDRNATPEPHTHVFFSLDNGQELRYRDVRRFGRMFVEQHDKSSDLAALGADPLEVTELEFRKLLQGRRTRIKALLLDQGALRGMGNIYADESLWRARIHPTRLASSLSLAETRCLYEAMRKILLQAIESKGSSISDYVDAEGRRGSFQLRHRVYQRTGKKCSRCSSIVRHSIVAGRSTHFCPRCQRAPRGRRVRQKTKARGKRNSAGAR